MSLHFVVTSHHLHCMLAKTQFPRTGFSWTFLRFVRFSLGYVCVPGSLAGWPLTMAAGTSHYIQSRIVKHSLDLRLLKGRSLQCGFAAKFPNADLNFAVDFGVDFSLLLFSKKKAQKNPPQNYTFTL